MNLVIRKYHLPTGRTGSDLDTCPWWSTSFSKCLIGLLHSKQEHGHKRSLPVQMTNLHNPGYCYTAKMMLGFY